jgi:hypothetical protein
VCFERWITRPGFLESEQKADPVFVSAGSFQLELDWGVMANDAYFARVGVMRASTRFLEAPQYAE